MPSRRMMMAYIIGHQSRLPAEFQEVEYIGSSGTQYIDTSFTPNQDTRVTARFSGTAGTISLFFGAGQNYNNLAYECYLQSGQYTSNYNDQNTYFVGSYTSDNVISIDKNKNNTTFETGGNTYNADSTYGIFEAPRTMAIFRLNRPNPFSYNSSVKMFSMQVYDNNVLVRDFVPCYRKADNEIGLYDLVNGVFYTNAGTGTFTKGPDV